MTSVMPGPAAPRLLAAALLPLALVLAGCSGGDDEDEALTPTDVLAEAKQTLDETSGVTINLTTDELPSGVDGVVDATGVGTHAPAFEGDLKVLVNNLTVEVPVVAVDGAVYAQLPFTSEFAEIDPADYGAPDPATLMDPDEGISAWLTAATGVEEGDQVRDGGDVLTSYTGTVPGSAVASVIPSADESAEFETTFTIDDDGQLDSAEIVGPFYGEAGDVDYTITLSDYGTDQDITAP